MSVHQGFPHAQLGHRAFQESLVGLSAELLRSTRAMSGELGHAAHLHGA
ncbi:hypothetical protein [Streptomyces sp. NPDC058622]